MTTPAVSLRDLAFRYAPASPLVLRGLTLDLPSTGVTALLGPNGCGKTTLLRLLLGLLSPTSGDVSLFGRPAASYTRRLRAQTVGWVPQTEHIPFDFSLLDYVLLGRAPYLRPLQIPGPPDVDVARAALDQVGLLSRAASPVTRLSGGEQQLAMVARALAQQPRLLLLDEPTSHLDLANRRAVRSVLLSLAENGHSLVFTTHDPQLAASTATHLVLLRDGALLRDGPLPDVFTSRNLSAAYRIPVTVIPHSPYPLVVS